MALKVGLFLDGPVQPRWVHRVVESVNRSPAAEISLVVFNGAAPTAPRALSDRFKQSRRHLLYSVYSRVDSHRYGTSEDPLSLADLTHLIEDVPVLDVEPRQTKWSDFFSEGDVTRIAELRLHLILRHGFRILRGDILEAAEYGIWSFHHGDNRTYRGGPPGYWEMSRGDTVTGTILQRIADDLDNGHVLYRSWARTDQHSLRRGQNAYYAKSAEFVVRVIERLDREGPDSIMSESEPFSPFSEPLCVMPSNWHTTLFLLRLTGRFFLNEFRRRLTREQWEIWFSLEDTTRPSLRKFTRMKPPLDRFWADPNIAVRGNRTWLFMEEFIYSEKRGHISACEIHTDGSWGEILPALERPYHLSYPQVFEWEGAWWMIPETAENRTVELYKCRRWPDDWELHSSLLHDVTAVDATIQEIDGRWQMWVNISVESASSNDELHLYQAVSPLGPWEPHRANPVVSDVRRARPAGPVFFSNGVWVRPSQDCSLRYGGATVLNRIDEISTTAYRETTIGRIEPHWEKQLLGTHTVNRGGGVTVVDAVRRRWKLGR